MSIWEKEAIVPSIPCFSLRKAIENLLQPLPSNLMVGPAGFCAHKASIMLPRVNFTNPGIMYIPSFAWIYKKRGQRVLKVFTVINSHTFKIGNYLKKHVWDMPLFVHGQPVA